MSGEPEDPTERLDYALSVHNMDCQTCADAMRWAHMCDEGKTLYDNMTAARYAKAAEQRKRNET